MRDTPWPAVRDRLQYSLGRQSYTLGENAEAVEHFLCLIERDETRLPALQTSFLDSLALAYEQVASRPEELEKLRASGHLQLPTPVFDATKTRVVLPDEAGTSAATSSSSGGRSAKWAALDAQALSHWDRKGKKPMSVLPDRKRFVAAVGETLHVELTATNPLSVAIVLTDVTVSATGAALDVEPIAEVQLEPYQTRMLSVAITPKTSGDFTVASVSFCFHRFLPTTQSLERQGKRLHLTKAQRLTPTYAKDTTLTVTAVEGAPRVVATLKGVPEQLYEGEVVEAELVLRNTGATPVEQAQMVCSQYGIVSLSEFKWELWLTVDASESSDATVSNVIPTSTPLNLAAAIAPGESTTVPVRFTALSAGPLEFLALVVYSAADGTPGAARLVQTADVKRLLTVTSDVVPARSGYVVTAEVVSHAETPITVGELVPVSQYWSTTTAPGATILPNQVFRAVFLTKASDASLDLQQSALVDNLGRVLQGHLDSLAPITPDTVTISTPPGYLLQRRTHRLRFAAQNFSASASDIIPRILPMFDPLDLDIVFDWTMGDRHGRSGAFGLRPAPDFSLVERLRADVDDGPGKRTMYQETGRIRQQVSDSILEGVYAAEEDPVVVRARVPDAKDGKVSHDFDAG